jgi:hypothetical protein
VADIALTGAEAKGGKLVAAGGQGTAVFKLPLPYVYVSGQIDAAFDGDGKLSVSVDGGKTWQPAASGEPLAAIKQKYDVQIKAEFAGALTKLKVDAVVEHNRSAQPYLLQGKNQVTVSAGKLAKDATLAVTYAYQEATAPDPAKRSRYEMQGVTYGAAKTATHDGSASPWTIEVGGNTPPKMLYLEYSVRGK